MSFGSRVREIREIRHVSQKDLAKDIGVTAQYLNDIERDRRRPPSDDVIQRLAWSLVVTTDFMYLWAGRLPPDLREFDELEVTEFKKAMDQFRERTDRRSQPQNEAGR